jgi:5'-nucleotidase
MRVLVTNDDGVDSDGLRILASTLTALGSVTVVAPDADRSGVSHSISTRHAVTATVRADRDVPTYACSGTPADCVVLGANELCGGRPDLVISGINRGANLADDIAYSGTVGAAAEAVLAGVPAIAVSLAARWPEVDAQHHWQTAADTALDLARATLAHPLPADTYWNLNVPNLPALAGLRLTRQGRKRYADRLSREDRGDGIAYYWLWGKEVERGAGETDESAVRAGFASLTPLKLERTDLAVLAAGSPWADALRDGRLPGRDNPPVRWYKEVLP